MHTAARRKSSNEQTNRPELYGRTRSGVFGNAISTAREQPPSSQAGYTGGSSII